MLSSLKFKAEYFLQVVEGKWVAAHEAEELYVLLALFMLKGIVQNLFWNCVSPESTFSHTTFWFCYFIG
jgi:hypothetical protein